MNPNQHPFPYYAQQQQPQQPQQRQHQQPPPFVLSMLQQSGNGANMPMDMFFPRKMPQQQQQHQHQQPVTPMINSMASSMLPSPSQHVSEGNTIVSEDERKEKTMSRKRKRTTKACAACRKSHACCDTNRPCARCVRLDLECVEQAMANPRNYQSNSSSSINSSSGNSSAGGNGVNRRKKKKKESSQTEELSSNESFASSAHSMGAPNDSSQWQQPASLFGSRSAPAAMAPVASSGLDFNFETLLQLLMGNGDSDQVDGVSVSHTTRELEILLHTLHTLSAEGLLSTTRQQPQLHPPLQHQQQQHPQQQHQHQQQQHQQQQQQQHQQQQQQQHQQQQQITSNHYWHSRIESGTGQKAIQSIPNPIAPPSQESPSALELKKKIHETMTSIFFELLRAGRQAAQEAKIKGQSGRKVFAKTVLQVVKSARKELSGFSKSAIDSIKDASFLKLLEDHKTTLNNLATIAAARLAVSGSEETEATPSGTQSHLGPVSTQSEEIRRLRMENKALQGRNRHLEKQLSMQSSISSLTMLSGTTMDPSNGLVFVGYWGRVMGWSETMRSRLGYQVQDLGTKIIYLKDLVHETHWKTFIEAFFRTASTETSLRQSHHYLSLALRNSTGQIVPAFAQMTHYADTGNTFPMLCVLTFSFDDYEEDDDGNDVHPSNEANFNNDDILDQNVS